MPLAMLVYGPIADFIKIEWLLIGTGLLMFAESLFMLGSKVLIEAGKPTSKPQLYILCKKDGWFNEKNCFNTDFYIVNSRFSRMLVC
jgi:hypothetical protein